MSKSFTLTEAKALAKVFNDSKLPAKYAVQIDVEGLGSVEEFDGIFLATMDRIPTTEDGNLPEGVVGYYNILVERDNAPLPDPVEEAPPEEAAPTTPSSLEEEVNTNTEESPSETETPQSADAEGEDEVFGKKKATPTASGKATAKSAQKPTTAKTPVAAKKTATGKVNMRATARTLLESGMAKEKLIAKMEAMYATAGETPEKALQKAKWIYADLLWEAKKKVGK